MAAIKLEDESLSMSELSMDWTVSWDKDLLEATRVVKALASGGVDAARALQADQQLVSLQTRLVKSVQASHGSLKDLAVTSRLSKLSDVKRSCALKQRLKSESNAMSSFSSSSKSSSA